jgi:HlyD family secretion protein
MDVKRDPAILRKKKIRQMFLLGLGAVAIAVISVAVMRLKPAAPSVPAGTLWYGTVKRGGFTREVHGAGTLVPEDIRWIPATTSGRVEKIVLKPGAQVKQGTVILELSNPDLRQSVNTAELVWKSGIAQLENRRADLRSQRLAQESNISDLESQYEVAKAKLEANKELGSQGLVGQIQIKQDQAIVDQAKNRLELAKQQLQITIQNEDSQIAPQIATVNQQKAQFDLVSRQLDDLKVKSTMDGQLQLVGVEVGQQVGPGTNLARVSDPTKLKAEVRISETQTKDLAIGLPAVIDTRNGLVPGHVIRIDPASQGGLVGVDVALDGALPPGARPDLSVDGTVQLQRLEDVLYVERPAFGQENNTVSLFKLVATGVPIPAGQEAGHEALRTQVQLGVSAVQFIEVKAGLQEGDRVVLSDMSAYDAYERVRLN